MHTLKVTLRDVRPSVWRRLAVPSAITLGQLHDILQVAFEWDDSHLHQFEARDVRYGPAEDDPRMASMFRDDARDEDQATIGRVVPRVGDVLDYTYDFGDDWQHRLVVEAVGPAHPDDQYPACLAGSGLPPEEDTGRTRPGRFGEATRDRINGYLQGAGAVAGRDLPVEVQGIDPHFAGLFPELDRSEEAECPCGCGHVASGAGAMVLPMLDPVPEEELAAQAAESPLVRQALALADWVAVPRQVTPAGLLRPADAVRAAGELGLVDPDSSPSGSPKTGGGRGAAGRGATGRGVADVLPLFGDAGPGDDPSSGAGSGAELGGRRVRSAKELTALHAVWTGCVAAGLIEVHGGKARPGPAVATWRSPGATPAAQIESWCALLGGQVRAWIDATHARRDALGQTQAQLLPAVTPLLCIMPREPVPVGLLAMMLADLDELEGTADDASGLLLLLELPALLAALNEVTAKWLGVGVLERAELSADHAVEFAAQIADLRAAVEEALDGDPDRPSSISAAQAGLAGLDAAVREALQTVTRSVRDGAVVRLTPLGGYGLARLLAAHGWEVPQVGECLDVEPQDLLGRLGRYGPVDAEAEAGRWIAARADTWRQDAGRVLWSASVKGPEGPPLRAALPPFLQAVGPRVAPLLEEAAADPWLASVSALTLHQLGLRPGRPAVKHLLWVVIDQLSTSLDDSEEFAEELEDSPLEALLAEPAGIATALAAGHPHTREVLKAAVPYLDDRGLSAALRKALSGRSGNPARSLGRGQGKGRGRGKR